MKKLLTLFLVILISIVVKSQGRLPNEVFSGNLKTEAYDSGARGSYYGFHFRHNYADTTDVNNTAPLLKTIPGFVVLANDTLRKRNATATRWDIIGSGSGGSGIGTVLSVSGLSPLFSVSNPTTTPTFVLSNTTAYTVFGRATSTGVPSYVHLDTNYISSFSTFIRPLLSQGAGISYNNVTGVITNTNPFSDSSFIRNAQIGDTAFVELTPNHFVWKSDVYGLYLLPANVTDTTKGAKVDTASMFPAIRATIPAATNNDSLLTVTRRNNVFDTINGNNINAIGNVPTEVITLGNSITFNAPATGCSDDSVYIRQFSVFKGITLTNLAVSGLGSFQAAGNFNTNINPGHTSMVTSMAGFNDVRYGGNNYKTYRKIVNSHVAIWANQYLKSYASATSSFTKYGSWATGYPCSSFNGKTANGCYSNVPNDSLRYSFADSTVYIGLIGTDGVTQITTDSADAYIDGVFKKRFATNNQTDGVTVGSSDNARISMGIYITGLTNASHILTLINRGSQYLIVDYVGHFVDVTNAYPLVFLDPPKMDATGYAIAPANASNATMDSVSHKFDSLFLALPQGYPNYHVYTNSYYNVANSGDHIHPNNTGQRQIYNGLLAAYSTSGIVVSDRSLFFQNGRVHQIVSGANKTLANTDELSGLIAATGISIVGDSIYNNLSIGKASGQSIIGGTGSAEDLTIHSNLSSNGKIIFGANSGFREAFNFLGMGTNNPGSFFHAKNLTNNTSFYAEANASQTNPMLQFVSSGGTPFLNVNAGGGVGIGGGVGGGGYAFEALWLQHTGGESYIDGYNGSAWHNINIRGLGVLLQESGNTVASATSNGFNIFNAFRPNNAAGTSGDILKSQGAGTYPVWVAQSTLTVPLSGITSMIGNATINNGDWREVLQWQTLTDGAGISLVSSSTTAASNSQKVLSISNSGANANSGQTTYGALITDSHSGTSSTNIALQLSSVSGTNNYALIVPANAGSVGIGNAAPVSLLDVTGSIGVALVTKTANYTADATDYTILCSTNTFTVTLPAAAGCTNRVYVIKNITSGTTITIDPNASETIDGSTTKVLNTQYSGYTIQSNGSAWFITSTF